MDEYKQYPDFEVAFKKLKQLIRGCRPRNWQQIVDATKKALLALSFDDLYNAFVHCGYEAT